MMRLRRLGLVRTEEFQKGLPVVTEYPEDQIEPRKVGVVEEKPAEVLRKPEHCRHYFGFRMDGMPNWKPGIH